MLPLYHKDGLTPAYISTTLIFASIAFACYALNESERGVSFAPTLTIRLASPSTIKSRQRRTTSSSPPSSSSSLKRSHTVTISGHWFSLAVITFTYNYTSINYKCHAMNSMDDETRYVVFACNNNNNNNNNNRDNEREKERERKKNASCNSCENESYQKRKKR